MFARALDQPEWMLCALAVDADRRHQHDIFSDMDAVDLHHHDVEMAEVRHHPFLHARRCQRLRWKSSNHPMFI
jgi:hypothetical protein